MSAWYNCKITCTICNKEWVATFPREAPALECPECGYMNPVPPLPENENEPNS